jgi:hypothetical protein
MELKLNPLHAFTTLTRIEGTSSTKYMLNSLFAHSVAQKTKMPEFCSARYQVLYLDGPSARTTKQLIRAGINPTKLLPVSYDENAYNECKRLAPYAMGGHLSTAIGDIGINIRGKRLAAVWLDYCGTFNGNKLTKVYPIKDIRQILRHYLTENSILALTFCLRDGRNRSRKQTMTECIIGVNKLLRDYDYSPDLSKLHITQYGKMIFMMYDLKRMPDVVDEYTMVETTDVVDEYALDESSDKTVNYTMGEPVVYRSDATAEAMVETTDVINKCAPNEPVVYRSDATAEAIVF